jgi:ABC-type sugar transport system permease subunit
MTAAAQPLPKRASGAGGSLSILVIWHLVLAVGAAAGMAGLIGNWWEFAPWLRWLTAGVLGFVALGSVAAAWYITRRDHKGRALSLTINYLGFLFCAVAFLQLIGAFAGFDVLAERFVVGLPFLLLAFVGYLIYAFGDRYDNYPKRQQSFQRVGKWVGVGGLALMVLAMIGWADALQFVGERLQPVILAMLLGMVVFGVTCWAMWRDPAAQAMHVNNARQEALEGFLFLSPNVIGFLLFLAGPLLLSLYTSFTNWDGFGTRDWVGLDNYVRLLSLTLVPLAAPDQLASQVLDVRTYDELWRFSLLGSHYLVGAADKLFWISLRNTFFFCLLIVPLSVIPAIILASILNSKLPGMKFFRAVYFIPSVAAVVGVALIWQWMYNATVGWINYGILQAANFTNQLLGTGIEAAQPRWLSSSDTALIAIAVMVIWQTLGFNTILFLAGMQNIPKALYEAATVDGASEVRQLWHITLPLLGATTVFVVSTTLIRAFQIFEPIFIMSNPAGGPNNATLSTVLYLYQSGFQSFRQGYASAVAWLLFLIIFVVTMIQYRKQSDETYEL